MAVPIDSEVDKWKRKVCGKKMEMSYGAKSRKLNIESFISDEAMIYHFDQTLVNEAGRES